MYFLMIAIVATITANRAIVYLKISPRLPEIFFRNHEQSVELDMHFKNKYMGEIWLHRCPII